MSFKVSDGEINGYVSITRGPLLYSLQIGEKWTQVITFFFCFFFVLCFLFVSLFPFFSFFCFLFFVFFTWLFFSVIFFFLFFFFGFVSLFFPSSRFFLFFSYFILQLAHYYMNSSDWQINNLTNWNYGLLIDKENPNNSLKVVSVALSFLFPFFLFFNSLCFVCYFLL